MKAIAAAVGLDPFLIERAARLVPAGSRKSGLERVLGGPVKYRLEAHFGTELTEGTSARILSLARAAFETHGLGEASSSGMSWSLGNAVGEASQIFVTAQTEVDGTRVVFTVDRRRALIPIVMFGWIGAALAVAFGAAVAADGGAPVTSPGGAAAIGIMIAGAGLAGTLALARTWWASTTRGIHETLDGLMDSISRLLSERERRPDSSEGTNRPRS